MINVDDYVKAHSQQKQEVHAILSEYIGKLNWSSGDLILDIGCGPGDVTAKILLPKLPHDIGLLIGSDLSEDMISHASANFTNEKLKFTQLDIATNSLDVDRFIDLIKTDSEVNCQHGIFDKLFSFFCLHWVTEQKLAIQNMYDLIKPSGEGLVVFVANCLVFDWYEKMCKEKQWQEYMTDVSKFVSPYHHSVDPRQEFQDVLQDVGFEVIECRTQAQSFSYETPHLFKNALGAINPFVGRLPDELKDEYIYSLVKAFNQSNKEDIVDQTNTNDDSQIVNNYNTFKYEIIIAHFRKLS